MASIRETRVLALVCRRADQDEDPQRRENYAVSEWEVPILEVVVNTVSTRPVRSVL